MGTCPGPPRASVDLWFFYLYPSVKSEQEWVTELPDFGMGLSLPPDVLSEGSGSTAWQLKPLHPG